MNNQRMHANRRLSRRDFLHLSGVAMGTFVVAGCTAVNLPAPDAEEGAVPAEEKVILRLQNWFSEGDIGAWQIGLDATTEAYPNTEIKLEYNSYGETAVKIMAEAAAGNMPDLIMASNEHTPILSTNLLLMDLNPYIDRDDDVNPDDFAAGVSQGFHMWGRWWGFPYDHSTYAVYYNKGMFDDAGVPYPPSEGEPWTMNEFVETAQALTKPDGEQWGVWFPPLSQYLDSCFIYSAGGRNFDDELRHCIIGSDEAAAGLQHLVDLIHVHKVAPTRAELAGGNIDYFASGLAAMHINGQWDLLGKNQTSDFDFDIGYLPIVDEKRTVTGGSGFCISTSTEHPDEAWDWLKLFTSGDVLADMVGRTGRGIPARWSATSAYLEAGGKAENPGVFIEQLQWSFNDRSVLAFFEFVDSYNRHLESIFDTGEGSIVDALITIQDETNVAMDEKWADVLLDI